MPQYSYMYLESYTVDIISPHDSFPKSTIIFVLWVWHFICLLIFRSTSNPAADLQSTKQGGWEGGGKINKVAENKGYHEKKD